MKRPLTPEEKALWEKVARSAKPLSSHRHPVSCAAAQERGKIAQDPAPQLRFAQNDKPLSAANYAGIDRNTAERFRKGQYPIDATLDLHGLSRDKAHAAFMRFLAAHYERGNRCLLVVTGKGLVLREAMPQWLAGLQPVILAFDTAKPKHGGTGAFYILLRRKR